jgi:hypothetical protein
MSIPKLQATKNYRLFTVSAENRPRCPQKHKRLRQSMERYGFLPCYPVVCVRDKTKHLVILDGQHRLAFAEELGLAVLYMVLDEAFDIPEVNSTQEKWITRNFAETYAAQGNKAYRDGLDFCERYKVPVGTGFGMLAGTASWHNIANEYFSGAFRIRDQEWAEVVGAIYSHLITIAPPCRNARLLEACMAAGRVAGFDPQRLIAGADRCREKLVAFSTRDAYLEMLEQIYNFGRTSKNLVPLKLFATQAMRDRNAVNAAKNNKNGKPHSPAKEKAKQ